ncbi:MAG: 50S ribosomal protein L25 [Proteobacteria bacterium]|nr:50S ribosomal protein L25 [Cystobacterineae bacterium]MCL2259060.1 50S ribosomal protein L25 [Cystobacterineae bacterium]MCL2314590.1 50S ribosomal protein L25 [Pseudomonadota bacterium]
MSTLIEAHIRPQAGKGASRKLRAQNLIPAVIYGKHLKEALHISVDPVVVRKAIQTPRKLNTVLTLSLSNGETHLVLLKDTQRHPLSDKLLHVDFLSVRENEPVKVNIPIILAGKPQGVIDGGVLSQQRRNLEVLALPASIPEQIEVDVSHLKIAQVLHVNDIAMPAGVVHKSNVNFTIATISTPDTESPAAVAAAPAAEAKTDTKAAAKDAKKK